MPSPTLNAKHQAGASNLVYLVLAAAVIVVSALAFFALRQQAEPEPGQAVSEPQQEQQVSRAEPPAVKTVDLQNAEIQQPEAADGGADDTASQGETGLFGRSGRTRPLTDGLAGGSEAQDSPQATAQAAERPANAVDAFDYGVLDGRVRIGVFGKGGIPDYKASVSDSQIVIRMPGEFRYVEQFSRSLRINRFGVGTARLARDARGMRMTITLTPALQHEPFLIEDSQGLMVAFEPRR